MIKWIRTSRLGVYRLAPHKDGVVRVVTREDLERDLRRRLALLPHLLGKPGLIN